MLKLRHRMYLQAFAEGSESVGDTSGMDGSFDSGLANQDDADSDLFGYEEPTETQDVSSASPDESGTTDGDDYLAFREKYRDRLEQEEGEKIQNAIQRRFKNQQSYEDSYNSLLESLAPLFLKYNLDGSDIDGLKNALAGDDSLLEDMAFNEGLTPEAMREKLQQKQENARLQKELERMREEQAQAQASRDAYNQFQNWRKEAEELKGLYPNFDLSAELENEKFRDKLVNSGDSLREVYEATHLQEIIAGAIQTTAQKAREAVTNDIRARGMRPPENGTRGGSVSVKKDVNDLTDKDIERIIARVRAGELVKL